MLSLTDGDINQVLNHMGHTWEVHKDYYRQYDSVGERLEIAKILMLQDQNRLNEFRDKNLGEIDVERIGAAQFQGNCSYVLIGLISHTSQLKWASVVEFNPWHCYPPSHPRYIKCI